MTNLEFFKTELRDAVKESVSVGINEKGIPVPCKSIKCSFCKRSGNCTDKALLEWLLTEHETDLYKICKNLKTDDKILVSNDGKDWFKRHFCEYNEKVDLVLAYANGDTSWTTSNNYAFWRYVKLPEEKEN